VLSASATLDPTRSVVSWSVEPSQQIEDAVAIHLYDDQARLWRIAAPPGTTSLRVPELPQDLRLTFNTKAVAGVTLHEESTVAGYADARLGAAELFGAPRLLQEGARWRRSRSGTDAP
jgi:hypothetical protein